MESKYLPKDSTTKPVFQIKTPEKKQKNKKKQKTMNTDIRKQGKESKNKHFHGEPKIRNKKESKPRSNLNLSNKKTQEKVIFRTQI